MVRVLHVMRSLNAGGIGAFVMNVYRKIDREKIQFDFALTHSGKGVFGNEIESLGGKIYYLTTEGNRGITDGAKQIINLYRLCVKNRYDIVHSHYYFANTWFLMAARRAKVPVRVSHCHNAGEVRHVSIVRKIFEEISKRLLFSQGTVFLGCSKSAVEFLYGCNALKSGKAHVLYNGIDYNRFNPENYDENEIRRDLNVENVSVCVFVGRYERQKNPLYALKVFNEVHKSRPYTRFVMIGYGSMQSDIESYISENHMQNVVKLLPPDTDVARIQAISNVMIAPSIWEGLGIAYIEAQKMSTVVAASKQIPEEVNMGYCEFVELNDEEKWKDKVISILDNSEKRKFDETKYKKFDVNTTVNELMHYYGIKQKSM